ncbi:MAG: hypothetical protein IPK99_01660 [Flavobacteriales bacterium]|nr:hypothetical protein [Flavobacteriales bacterium]
MKTPSSLLIALLGAFLLAPNQKANAQSLTNTLDREVAVLCFWRQGTSCPGDVLDEVGVKYSVPADSSIVPMRPAGQAKRTLNRVEICCDPECTIRSEVYVTCSGVSSKGKCKGQAYRLTRSKEGDYRIQ